ncbi:nickel pincer cofactor biosynthesis protein LarB [Agrobacterium tumefaciens]|uniref:nickel pincer cofactor biosynthesis protein LarB n=1 Tax=Agrobacterium tumefaciens TaxID=358 RepID=UPI00054F877C|nr:nickel pincer cofactor biosynthesis protein LarB [Agrobacterium tumefaciens]
MTDLEFVFDYGRRERMGLDESVFCEGKSIEQIVAILTDAQSVDAGLLLTRLDGSVFAHLPESLRDRTDYHALSRTAFFGPLRAAKVGSKIAIIAAGTCDTPVAYEAARTLRHAGVEAKLIADVGVAGLWRLTERLDEIRQFPIVIAVAGMDAALASVLGGLISSVVICVPTSVGYGAADQGRTALGAMLSSCASGLTVCNIDNGYGAASAALRILNTMTNLR